MHGTLPSEVGSRRRVACGPGSSQQPRSLRRLSPASSGRQPRDRADCGIAVIPGQIVATSVSRGPTKAGSPTSYLSHSSRRHPAQKDTAMTSPATSARRLIAGAALASSTALVTACGGSGTPAPAATVTVTTAPAAGATATSSPAATSPSTATAPAGPAACPTSALLVKTGLVQGAAGSIYAVIDFVNISSVTCSLYGYPGVSFVTASSGGSQIGLAATESKTAPRQLVTLAPGATGNALLRIVQAGNYPASKCHL